jgi:hypothetical protein
MSVAAAYAAKKDSCFECHEVQEGMSIVFKDDIHYKYGVSCADCHGGDPSSDDGNVSMSAERGFTVRVTREGMPAYCGRCHSHPAVMKKYGGTRVKDHAALYLAGVHGKKLVAGGAKPAQCVDCHGVHGIRAAGDPKSRVHALNLAETCGTCHAEPAALFKKGKHASLFRTKAMAACSVCHASHETAAAGVAALTSAKRACSKCHSAGSKPGQAIAAMVKKINALPAAEQREAARRAAHALTLAP